MRGQAASARTGASPIIRISGAAASTAQPINPGFTGEARRQSAANFAKLTDPNYAYTVKVPPAERDIKRPAWLNDPIYYHNRGNSTFRGESSTMGDFVGLDDVFTENPRVVRGMIDIYGAGSTSIGVDGFRIDTAQHVNPEFWQKFVPAMLARARKRRHPALPHLRRSRDERHGPGAHRREHARRQAAERARLRFHAGRCRRRRKRCAGTDELAKLFRADPLYEGGSEAALQLPTFIGNHDAGRIRAAASVTFAPNAPATTKLLKRDMLAHAMLLTLRGVPTIYSGDEQGFVGKGGDQDARQDMFPSKVASYNEDKLLGTSATTAQSNFDPDHPLYREIAELAHIRTSHPRADARAAARPLFVRTSRGCSPSRGSSRRTGREMLLLFNTSTAPIAAERARRDALEAVRDAGRRMPR